MYDNAKLRHIYKITLIFLITAYNMTSIDPNKYKLSDKTKNLTAQG